MSILSRTRHAERIEANWRIFRLSGMLSTSVLLVILLTIDFSFGFASWQYNVVIGLVALCMFVLFKLDYWIHMLTRVTSRRRARLK